MKNILEKIIDDKKRSIELIKREKIFGRSGKGYKISKIF